jgi:site-specific DNA-methyltransferase (adenine-specific)
MSRIERIGDATLYLGDCRDILPTLGPVDAVVTDPPWGINFSEYESHKDDASQFGALMADLLRLSEPLVQDGWFVIFQGPKRAHEWATLIPREWRLMACAKNFTQILPGYGPQWSTDFALFWRIGTPRNQRGRGRDFHVAITSDFSTRPKGHPCPRPLDQMVYVVDCFTDEGMACLDPFMGSGTTGVACANLGRKFIGIEIESKYFDIACRRIEEAYRQPRLFTEPAAKPVQEVML